MSESDIDDGQKLTPRNGGQTITPAVLQNELTNEQHGTLRDLEAFGWRIRFIRHPAHSLPVVVVTDRAQNRHVVLSHDGGIIEEHGLVIRD